jgi:hypothetical protein
VKRQIVWNTATLEDGDRWTVYLSHPPNENPEEWEVWSAAFAKELQQDVQLNGPLPAELIRGAISVRSLDDAEETASRLEGLVDRTNVTAEKDAERARQEDEARRQGKADAAVRAEEAIDRLRRRPPGPPVS